MVVIRPAIQRIRRLAFLASRVALRTTGSGSARVVFVLGHMRSGSTLLTHLLLTHPRIIGGGESHTRYRTDEDFDRLSLWTRVFNRAPWRRALFVADQIVHDDFTPETELLRHPRVRSLLLIREPLPSISSLVRFTRAVHQEWTFQQATDAYIQRVDSLARHARTLGGTGQILSLNHRDIIDDTPATLGRVQQFLGLERGFSERYSLQRFTGIRGDRSKNIRAGRIVRDRAPEPLDVPSAELRRAGESYANCLQAMKLPRLNREEEL